MSRDAGEVGEAFVFADRPVREVERPAMVPGEAMGKRERCRGVVERKCFDAPEKIVRSSVHKRTLEGAAVRGNFRLTSRASR